MFWKKPKPASEPDSHSAPLSLGRSGSGSLFAPELNPLPARVNFTGTPMPTSEATPSGFPQTNDNDDPFAAFAAATQSPPSQPGTAPSGFPTSGDLDFTDSDFTLSQFLPPTTLPHEAFPTLPSAPPMSANPPGSIPTSPAPFSDPDFTEPALNWPGVDDANDPFPKPDVPSASAPAASWPDPDFADAHFEPFEANLPESSLPHANFPATEFPKSASPAADLPPSIPASWDVPAASPLEAEAPPASNFYAASDSPLPTPASWDVPTSNVDAKIESSLPPGAYFASPSETSTALPPAWDAAKPAFPVEPEPKPLADFYTPPMPASSFPPTALPPIEDIAWEFRSPESPKAEPEPDPTTDFSIPATEFKTEFTTAEEATTPVAPIEPLSSEAFSFYETQSPESKASGSFYEEATADASNSFSGSFYKTDASELPLSGSFFADETETEPAFNSPEALDDSQPFISPPDFALLEESPAGYGSFAEELTDPQASDAQPISPYSLDFTFADSQSESGPTATTPASAPSFPAGDLSPFDASFELTDEEFAGLVLEPPVESTWAPPPPIHESQVGPAANISQTVQFPNADTATFNGHTDYFQNDPDNDNPEPFSHFLSNPATPPSASGFDNPELDSPEGWTRFIPEAANGDPDDPFSFAFAAAEEQEATEEEKEADLPYSGLASGLTAESEPPSVSEASSLLESRPENAGQFLDTVNDTLYPPDILGGSASGSTTDEPFSTLSVNEPEQYAPGSLSTPSSTNGEDDFYDAARYLFPETVITPPEWEQRQEPEDTEPALPSPGVFDFAGDSETTDTVESTAYRSELTAQDAETTAYNSVYWPDEAFNPDMLDLGESKQNAKDTGMTEFKDLSDLPLPVPTETAEPVWRWGEEDESSQPIASLTPIADPFEAAETGSFSSFYETPEIDDSSPSYTERSILFPEPDDLAGTTGLTQSLPPAIKPTAFPMETATDLDDFAGGTESYTQLYPEASEITAATAAEAGTTSMSATWPSSSGLAQPEPADGFFADYPLTQAAHEWPLLNPEEPGLIIPTEPPAPLGIARLGRLNIIGVCPLSVDRRLLVVHNGEVFALMVQNGPDSQSNVSVLKIFDRNPLAYQTTFTAVPDTRSDRQGLYMLQVGSLHGVISVFKENIAWYQELS